MRWTFRRWGWVAALPVCLAAAAGLRAQEKTADGSPGDLKEVVLRGRLVSLGEEMARKYGARLAGAGPEPQWALTLPEGELYTFLDNEGYRRLAGAGLAGAAVEVKARHFPRSMLLEVLTFRPIPAETIRRRFHCGVCNIYFDDFGPCVCCGLEVRLVRE